MIKPYKRAFLCGRMGHLHKGHQRLIDQALEQAEQVLIVLGSAQESGTLRNPFSASFRAKLIKTVYPQVNVLVSTLADMTNEEDITTDWGRYLLNHVREQFLGEEPDLMIFGNDESRTGWFDPKDITHIDEIKIEREKMPISATELREDLMENRFEHWASFVDPKLHPLWNDIQMELANAPAYWGKVKLPVPKDGSSILFHTKWLELRVKNEGYLYTHDPWCDSVGVGILPYRIKENGEMECLTVLEQRPCHPKKGYYAITGGYDNSERFTLLECALNEVKEEGGYALSPEMAMPLGSVYVGRGSDGIMHLFAVKVPFNAIQKSPKGDGTVFEKDLIPTWISMDEAYHSNDAVLLALLLRFKEKKPS